MKQRKNQKNQKLGKNRKKRKKNQKFREIEKKSANFQKKYIKTVKNKSTKK